MSDRRMLIPATDEHRAIFPTIFRLRREYMNDPEAQAAFEHATNYRLWPDEIDYIGMVIERIAESEKEQK